MDEAEKLSLEGIGRFVTASEEIQFAAENREQLYGWVERVLVGQQYAEQGKAARGLLRRYVEKMTGLSRAAGDAADRSLHGQRAGPGDGLSATAVLATVHTSRHRIAGLGRRGARDAERAGDTAHSGARTPALQAARVCAAGRYFRRSPV